MNQFIRQLEIVQRLQIRIHIKVHVIIGKRAAKAMVMIDHAGNAVEAEAVEVILFLPEFQVAQQEMQDFHLAVIKQLRSPGGMPSFPAPEEILVLGPVLKLEPLADIRAGMAVNHIQKYADSQFMRAVNQIFQILRHAVPMGRGEEVGHLIAE